MIILPNRSERDEAAIILRAFFPVFSFSLRIQGKKQGKKPLFTKTTCKYFTICYKKKKKNRNLHN